MDIKDKKALYSIKHKCGGSIKTMANSNSLKYKLINPNQLTNLIWKGISLCDDPSFHELFQYISLHKSLENIEFEIEDFYMEINQQFFDILINFCKKKPNTKIVIKIPKQSEDDEKFIDYKKLYEDVKHPHKFNMELKYFNIQSIILYYK